MPAGDELVYSMEGSLWRQRIGSERGRRAYARQRRLRLSAGRRAGRPKRRLQPLRRPRDRTVAARSRKRPCRGADREWRRQHRVPALAGRQTNRLRFDGRQRAFQPEDRRHRAAAVCRTNAISSRRARARSTATTIPPTITPSIRPGRPMATRVYYVSNAEIPWGTGSICSVAVADRKVRMSRPGTHSSRRGRRGRRSRRTGSGFSFRIITAGSGISSGSRRRPERRRCRSRTANSTGGTPAGRRTAGRLPTSATRAATRRSPCRNSWAARGRKSSLRGAAC